MRDSCSMVCARLRHSRLATYSVTRLDQPHDHVDGGQHEQLGVPVLDAEHPADDRVVALHDDVDRGPDEQLGHDVGQLVEHAERDGGHDGPPVPPGVAPQAHERRGGGVVGGRCVTVGTWRPRLRPVDTARLLGKPNAREGGTRCETTRTSAAPARSGGWSRTSAATWPARTPRRTRWAGSGRQALTRAADEVQALVRTSYAPHEVIATELRFAGPARGFRRTVLATAPTPMALMLLCLRMCDPGEDVVVLQHTAAQGPTTPGGQVALWRRRCRGADPAPGPRYTIDANDRTINEAG